MLPFLRSGSVFVQTVVLGTALAAVACGSDSSGNNDDSDDKGGAAGTRTRGGAGGTAGDTGGAGKGGTAGKGGSTGKGGAAGKGGVGGTGAVPDIGDIGGDPQPERPWTIFVYGHGDHNLSYSLLVDLREMAAAEISADVNVLVLTDWDASQTIAGTDPPETYPDGIQLFRVPGGGADLEVVAEGAEANLDDPDVLASLVESVFTAFPSERRAVILWDHGGSWSGGFGSDTQNGTETSPVPMAAQAIPEAVAAGLEAAGVTATPPLDIFAFDTCLMGGAEVAYPFLDLATVYLANAEIDYGSGWDYETTFGNIAANPDANARTLATSEVEAWDAHHATATTNDALLRSHVALRMDRMEAFAGAVADLSGTLSESTSFDAIELGRTGFFSLPPYASQFENAASSIPELKDMGQILDGLAATTSDPAVAEAAVVARGALDDVVIGSSQGTLRAGAGQAGVHVEQGLVTQLTQEHLDAYLDRASSWLAASDWQLTLAAAIDGADLDAPTLDHSVPSGGGASQADPPILEFTTPDTDVAKATVQVGQFLTDGSLALLGLIGAGQVESGADYEFAWDGMVASFDDGQPAMIGVWLDAGDAENAVYMVPGMLDGAAEEPLLTFLVFGGAEDSASMAVVSLGSVASTLSVAEIAEAAPGSTFSPLYVVIDPDSGDSSLATGDPIAVPSDAFPLGYTFMDAGDYALVTSLTDVWGNEAVVADAVTLLEPLGP